MGGKQSKKENTPANILESYSKVPPISSNEIKNNIIKEASSKDITPEKLAKTVVTEAEKKVTNMEMRNHDIIISMVKDLKDSNDQLKKLIEIALELKVNKGVIKKANIDDKRSIHRLSRNVADKAYNLVKSQMSISTAFSTAYGIEFGVAIKICKSTDITPKGAILGLACLSTVAGTLYFNKPLRSMIKYYTNNQFKNEEERAKYAAEYNVTRDAIIKQIIPTFKGFNQSKNAIMIGGKYSISALNYAITALELAEKTDVVTMKNVAKRQLKKVKYLVDHYFIDIFQNAVENVKSKIKTGYKYIEKKAIDIKEQATELFSSTWKKIGNLFDREQKYINNMKTPSKGLLPTGEQIRKSQLAQGLLGLIGMAEQKTDTPLLGYDNIEMLE